MLLPNFLTLAALPNGVAAGDTTSTDTVLWAHSTTLGQVLFEISSDPLFGAITASASVPVSDPLLPVKVAFSGLNAGTDYFYRATDAESSTASGRFLTAAPAGVQAGLAFGVSGDWRGELSPYPAVRNVPGRNLDFFAALGDTIYADYSSPDLPQPQTLSLADYRIKNKYRSFTASRAKPYACGVSPMERATDRASFDASAELRPGRLRHWPSDTSRRKRICSRRERARYLIVPRLGGTIHATCHSCPEPRLASHPHSPGGP